MATMSCERGDIERELIIRGQSYKQWLKETSCLDCPNNNHHDYPIMGGHITASFCRQNGEWLDPSEYRRSIAEMGCEPEWRY